MNNNADFLSRLPQPATDFDTAKMGRLSHPDDVDVYFVGASGFWPRLERDPSQLSSVLGGLPAPSPSLALGGLHTVPPPPCYQY